MSLKWKQFFICLKTVMFFVFVYPWIFLWFFSKRFLNTVKNYWLVYVTIFWNSVETIKNYFICNDSLMQKDTKWYKNIILKKKLGCFIKEARYVLLWKWIVFKDFLISVFLFSLALSPYVALFIFGANRWGVVWHKRFLTAVWSELYSYLLFIWTQMCELGYIGLQICFDCWLFFVDNICNNFYEFLYYGPTDFIVFVLFICVHILKISQFWLYIQYFFKKFWTRKVNCDLKNFIRQYNQEQKIKSSFKLPLFNQKFLTSQLKLYIMYITYILQSGLLFFDYFVIFIKKVFNFLINFMWHEKIKIIKFSCSCLWEDFFIFWKPLFKRISYFGYYRTNRAKWYWRN